MSLPRAAARRAGMTGDHMRALGFLSSSGRLSPTAFVFAAIGVYLLGAASHLLTVPEVIARSGFWPFAAIQALLTWVWYAIHAKRLRDSGRGIGVAAGVALLYALSVVLLVIVAASFYQVLADQQASDTNAASALGLMLLVSIIAVLLGSSHYDLASVVVTILLLMAFVPVVAAVAVTFWAATRPSGQERTV